MNRVIILLISFLLASCTSSYYEKSYIIENEIWDSQNILQYNIDVDNNNEVCDIFINVKNTTEYEFANIFLFVSVLYPDNSLKIDTVEGYITNQNGQWLGSGSGRYKNNKFIYKSNIIFPQKGKYVFNIEQAMRDEALKGISAVGLEVIEKQ